MPEGARATMRGKTMVFIDNSNLYQGSKNAGWRVDPKLLIELIEQRGPVWQTYFFGSKIDELSDGQIRFYDFLRYGLRFEIVLLDAVPRTRRCAMCGETRDTFVEKGVDVALATRMLTLANARAFETAVLVSGDKDYLETVQHVKWMGMRVEVYSWRPQLSAELGRASSQEVVYFDDHREELENPAMREPEDASVVELDD